MVKEKVKAMALDVDGTITDNNRRLCVNSIKAIHHAERNGVPVIIVTGNILCATRMLAIMLGTTGGLISENGGVIEYQKRKEILGNISECVRAYEYLKTIYPIDKVDFSEERISEIAVDRTVKEEDVKEALKNFNVEVYDTKFAIHITDPVVNKGSSLIRLAEYMGIKTKDIMAIGDSENDIEFLEVAGLKIAVGNADEELKAIADYVTERPFGDGVKEAVLKFIK